MARKSKRPYGTGSVLKLKNSLAIRWWETVIGSDGLEREVMRYENLGPVSLIEAEDRLAEKRVIALRAGPRREQVIPTFSEHVARYQRDILELAPEAKAPVPSPVSQNENARPHIHKFSTRLGRSCILNHHLIPRFGPMLVSSITTAEVQKFFSELCAAGFETKAGGRQEYSAHTLHDIREVLRVVMNFSNEWYGQPVNPITGQPFNPVVGVKLPKLKPKMRPWALTEEQSGKLIGKLKGKAKPMVALAIILGMRRGELLALRMRHLSVRVDAGGNRSGLLTIEEASYLGHVDTPKTEAGVRTIDVPGWVFGLIEDWIRLSRKKKSDDLVFGTRTNRVENSNNILRRHVFPACDALEFARATWLTFRRTFSTLAHDQGVSARTIADIMGHAEVGTQFTYIQPVDGAMRAATDRIGNRLCKIVQDFENERALIH